jgi:hypothetical protein
LRLMFWALVCSKNIKRGLKTSNEGVGSDQNLDRSDQACARKGFAKRFFDQKRRQNARSRRPGDQMKAGNEQTKRRRDQTDAPEEQVRAKKNK